MFQPKRLVGEPEVNKKTKVIASRAQVNADLLESPKEDSRERKRGGH